MMDIESIDGNKGNFEALKRIRSQSSLQSTQNVLRACDWMIFLFYVIMWYWCDLQKENATDAHYFVRIWMFSILLLQLFIVFIGFRSKNIRHPDDLEKWVFLRKLHHLLLIFAFLLSFVSGYHEVLGISIFLVSLPWQFWLTSLWRNTIKFEELDESKGLMMSKDPPKSGNNAFGKFEDEVQKAKSSEPNIYYTNYETELKDMSK